jgi:VCBS repeat-containing protein
LSALGATTCARPTAVSLGASPLPGDLARDLHISATSGDPIVVADTDLLFFGEYKKVGFDLVIQDAEGRLTIHDYFRQIKRPALLSRDGASLSEQVVEALAGATEGGERYAQAGGSAPQPTSIGRVEVATGIATAQRNGVTITLQVGDLVYKGDVVQTDRGSTLGITFIDGTTFSLAASARMVLNDMVYQAGGTANASLMSLVQGSISFVAGQVAKTGDMRVETPVATMGIRGTAVLVDIEVNTGQVRLAVMREQDGTGRFDVYKRGDPNTLLFSVSDPGVAFTVSPAGPFEVTFAQVSKTAADLSAEQAIVQALVQIFSVSQARGVIPAGATADPAPTGPPGPTGQPGTGGSGSPSQVIQAPVIINPGGLDRSPNPQPDGGVTPPGSPGSPGQEQPRTGQPPTDTGRDAFPSPPSGEGPRLTAIPPSRTDPASPESTPTVTPVTTAPVISTPGALAIASQQVTVIEDRAIVAATVAQGVLSSGAAAAEAIAAAKVTLVRAIDGPGTADVPVPVDPADLAVVTGRFGTLAIASDGRYSYAALRATALGEGERETDAFSYTVVNTGGATSVAVLAFEIVGTNDDPVVAGIVTATAIEDGPAVAIDPLSLASDPDRGTTLSVVVPAELPPGISFDVATGRFVLDPANAPSRRWLPA